MVRKEPLHTPGVELIAPGNLGFNTFRVEDGCFTFARKDWTGTLRAASEVHAMSLANLDGEYCMVTQTAEVLAASSP